MNYEDSVKRLRNIGDGGIYEKCEGCEYGEDYPDCVGCTHKAFYDAADAIEELLQKTQQLEERTLPSSPFEDFFRYYAEKYGTGMLPPEPPKEET